MDSLSFLHLCVAVIATYAMHSTLLLIGAWLAEATRIVKSPGIREQLWKWAAVAPLVTTAVQLNWTDSAPVWQWQLGEPVAVVNQNTLNEASVFGSPIQQSSVENETSEIHENDKPELSSASVTSADELTQVISVLTDNDIHSNEFSPAGSTDDERWVVEIVAGESQTSELISPLSETAMRPANATEWPNPIVFRTSETLPARDAVPSGSQVGSSAVVGELDVRKSASLRRTASTIVTVIVGCLMIGLLRLIVSLIRIERHLAACTERSNGESATALKAICQARGINKKISLLISERILEPSACGVFRWTVVLPKDLEANFNHCELTALLSHEVGHLVRRDTTWLWIGRTLTFCFPWQPLNFLAVQRWQKAAEFQCDEWALRGGVTGVTLARVLANVAEWKTSGAMNVGLPASAPPLSLRIERLLEMNRRSDRWNSGWRHRILLLLLFVMSTGVCVFGPRTIWAATPESPQWQVIENNVEVQTTPTVPRRSPPVPSLRQEFQELAADLEIALRLLEQQENDEMVSGKTTQILERLQQIQDSIENLE